MTFSHNNNSERKNEQNDSYARIEKIVQSSQFLNSKPSAEFKSKLLSELKQEAFSPKTMDTQKNRSWFQFNWTVMPAAIGITALVIVLSALYITHQIPGTGPIDQTPSPIVIHTPSENSNTNTTAVAANFNMVAVTQDATGINPTTSFQLSSDTDTNKEEIEGALRFVPEIAYEVKPIDAKNFEIKPDQALPANTIVQATMAVVIEAEDGTKTPKNVSWSYQVQEKFQIVSTLPRNQATGAPVNTGIEITFSHSGFQNFEQNFSIEPAVEGNFEIHDKTAVFVPKNPLANVTYYKITITKNVVLEATGETLEQDFTFAFETEKKSDDTESSVGAPSISAIIETSSQDAPSSNVFGIYSEAQQSIEGTLSIYKLPTEEAYIDALESYTKIPEWAYDSKNHWSVDTKDLTLLSTTKVPLQRISSWEYAVTAPDALEKGYYIMELQSAGTTDQGLVIVSDITSYVTLSETQLVIWAHDAISKDPLSGAKVTLEDGTLFGTTNADGMVSAETPKNLLTNLTNPGYVKLETENDSLYVPLVGSDAYTDFSSGESRVQPYWSYLYFDKPVYKPTDSINFWGVVKNRNGEIPENIEAEIITGYDWDQTDSVVDEKTVAVSDFGTFTDSIDISNYMPNTYYHMILLVDGKEVYNKNIEILQYVKPAYDLTLTPENYGVIRDEEVTHTITASFFDGTPASNMELRVNDGGVLTADEFGKASFTKTYRADENQYGSYEWPGVSATTAEEGEISAGARVRVFAASRLFDLKAEAKNLKAEVAGTLHNLDIDGFNNGKFEFYDMPYGNILADEDVHMEVTRRWYTKRQTDTYYDFVSKTTEPIYTYDEHSENVLTRDLTTDKNGNFTLEFDMLKDSSYDITASSKDEKGREVKETTYVWGASNNYGANYNYFSMQLMNENKDGYSLGENVETQFLRNGEILEEEDQKHFLYIKAREGIQDTQVSNKPTYNFTFQETDIPNVLIQGVWFDGRSYWFTDPQFGHFDSGTTASFNEKDRVLNTTITTDKETYLPGDTATVNMEVTDKKQNGAEAVVNINLVDEAIYAILEDSKDEKIDFNTQLYRDTSSGIYTSYASDRYPAAKMASEGGGGGGGPRSVFQDTVIFQTVKTDKNGKAAVQFKLPDNLTSWRITTHAINEEYYAGDNVAKLIVKQPFFVNAVMNETYLESDQPIIKVRALGDGITKKNGVEINVASKTLGLDSGASTHGYAANDIQLPNLTSGAHEFIISAKSGSYEDAIKRTITVLPSRITVPTITSEEATEGWTPSVETDKSFSVTLSDQHVGKFYQNLENISYVFGQRSDQQAARQIAGELLGTYFQETRYTEKLNPGLYQLFNNQNDSGGITLLPYSDEELILSTDMVASNLGKEFDKDRLTKYFEAILYDPSQTTLRHAQSLYGLAALQQPVKLEIDAMLSSDQITDVDRIFLGLAKAELGDQDGAKAIYDEITQKYGKTYNEYEYIDLGGQQDFILRNTLNVAIMGSLLQDENADKLFFYVVENTPKDMVFDLPKINFLTSRMEYMSTSPTTIVYEHLGQEKTVELKNGQTETIVLTPETRDTFTIKSVEGKALALTKSLAKRNPESLKTDESIGITRKYPETTMNDNDIVRITITANIPDAAANGIYEITDFLPSGLMPITKPMDYIDFWNTRENITMPYSTDGQKVSFTLWSGSEQKSFTYLARVVNKGTFTAESPVIQWMNAPSLSNTGEETTITIK